MAARNHDPHAFDAETEPHRRELLSHCYRMLGSYGDAEDAVQEAYLRAWRGWAGFERRSSTRTWLYRIATNVCLDALQDRTRRALPSGLVPAREGGSFDVDGAWADETWIEPWPDGVLMDPPVTPEAVVVGRSSTRLAMVAALQTLSAKERAAVILHDVVRLRSAEVADCLDTTPAAVNSALQRARARLTAAQPREDEVTEPDDPRCRTALETYVAAFAAADVPAIIGLLRDDVTIEMPPVPTWFSGVEDVSGFFRAKLTFAGQWQMLPTVANGQPAAAAYRRDAAGRLAAHSLHVLTVTRSGLSRVTAFRCPELFLRFGLPPALDEIA